MIFEEMSRNIELYKLKSEVLSTAQFYSYVYTQENWKQDFYMRVTCGTILNSQKIETNQFITR